MKLLYSIIKSSIVCVTAIFSVFTLFAACLVLKVKLLTAMLLPVSIVLQGTDSSVPAAE